MNARKLRAVFFALAILPAKIIYAQESPEELASESSAMGQIVDSPRAPLRAPTSEPLDAPRAKHESGVAEKSGPVVAMEAKSGKSVRAGDLFTAGGDPALLINRHNQRFEISPRSVVELDEQGALRLLRGSVVAESREETSLSTAGAKVSLVGKALVSFDHAEKSTSAFVLEGEARLENAHRGDSSLRLQRFHGATLVVGEVLPQLVRQLDVGSVQGWLAGYSWPAARRAALLKEMPGAAVVAKEEVPKHLEETKIEDYFSSIDTADEFHQPDYYEKKFEDPDKVVAEANSKQGASKTLTPEEAALISLPKTQIDLGFDLGPEFLSSAQKSQEVAKVEQSPAKSMRMPASATVSRKAAVSPLRAKVVTREPGGDPEVTTVLERLRQVRASGAAVSRLPAGERAPASRPETAVPDPIYDYSQNF